MKSFRRHWIACAILSIPIAITGCNPESGNDGDTANPTPAVKAPVVSPIMLTSPLPTNMASAIDLSSAITPGDGDNNVLTQLSLQSQASEGCELLPLFDGNRITVTPTDSNDGNVVMCSYDYTVGEDKLSATSTLAFAAVGGKTLTPTLPWLGGVGLAGEDIVVTVTAKGELNTAVIVLGDATTAPDVDTTAKTITFTGNRLGVTRVMYTVTDPTNNETKVGIIDFTVSADINTAPTASRGDISIAKETVTTITLSSFTQPNGTSGSLVTDRDYSGNGTGHAGLTIHNLVAPLGVELTDPNTGDLSFTVKTTRPGIFPVFYSITDGEGGYASDYIWVTTEGDAGLIVRDASFNLEPTTNARELTIDVADFAQVSSGVAQLSIEGTPAITNQQAPSSTGYNATVTSTGTKVTYRYAGSGEAGMSNITYKLKDTATGLIADGNIYISVDNQLPAFTANSLSVTNNNSHATPETGDTLTPTVTCDTATSCDVSKTKWVWKQSGDVVGDSEVDGEKAYTVQFFPCNDTLELWATPVGTYNDNGQIKDVEGIPVKMDWVSPDALTASLSKASAKEGEEVTLTLKSCQGSRTAKVAINTGLDRQNRAQTDHLAKIKDTSANVASKTVNLDANGEATLTLVAPKGGLKSTISITSGGKSATEHVTFSTITSPDTPLANRYGFMTNYVDSPDGVWRYHRALLYEEAKHLSGAKPTNGIFHAEQYLASESRSVGSKLCAAYGRILPTVAQIDFVRFSNKVPLNKTITDVFGWVAQSRLNSEHSSGHDYALHPEGRVAHFDHGLFLTTNWQLGYGDNLLPPYGLACMERVYITTIKNAHTFEVDSGFPTTAFDGAQFKLHMSTNNAGYSFESSDSTNAPVDNDGVITMLGKPTGEVTITASKDGKADFEYKFTINKWWLDVSDGERYSKLLGVCPGVGATLPHQSDLSAGGPRNIGSLLGEWGSMQSYGWYESAAWLGSASISGNTMKTARQGSGLYINSTTAPGNIYRIYCYQ